VNDRTTIGDAKTDLRQRIANQQTALHILEALTAPMPRSTVGPSHTEGTPARKRRNNVGVGRAAIEILRRAGRPMHGLSEIVPALQAAGYHVHAHGLATTLLRTGLVERTGRGTFAVAGGAVDASIGEHLTPT
jgi:hypothetical protein